MRARGFITGLVIAAAVFAAGCGSSGSKEEVGDPQPAKVTPIKGTDLSTVTLTEVKAALVDISKEVDVYRVDKINDGVQIKDFVQAQGVAFTKGCAFYQLSKTETVQDYKQIAIRDKISGAVYSGFAARDMLGLPHHGEVKLAPGQHGQYDIFVQSTSVNRKLVEGTNLMIWTAVTV